MHRVKELCNARTNVIVQGFGEPLLDKGYVDKIRFAKAKGIEPVICVISGTLLYRNISERLINAGLNRVPRSEREPSLLERTRSRVMVSAS